MFPSALFIEVIKFRLLNVRIQLVPFSYRRKNAHSDYFVTQSTQVFVALVQSSLFFCCTVQFSAVAAISCDRSFPSHHDVIVLVVRNVSTEDLKTDRNSASGTSADTERIRNSQISGQQELNADDTDQNSLKKRQFFIKRIYDRIRNIFQSIRTKLQNIRRTFGKIKKNVSWWKAFIEHPRVTAARKLVWKHGKFLLKHIFPTRIEGQVTFSFEDPALTGAAHFPASIPLSKMKLEKHEQTDILFNQKSFLLLTK